MSGQPQREIDALGDDSPLNRHDHMPVVVPTEGVIPEVVARWGPRSQLRWFNRFVRTLSPRPMSEWNRYHVQSLSHTGLCCDSCLEDVSEGYEPPDAGLCCCRGVRVPSD